MITELQEEIIHDLIFNLTDDHLHASNFDELNHILGLWNFEFGDITCSWIILKQCSLVKEKLNGYPGALANFARGLPDDRKSLLKGL